MLIRFTKSRHGPVLVCTRDDGSVTGLKSRRHGEFFVRHDLMHYAVETVLGLREAFFGLVAAGRSIESFNEPGAAKTLPAEASLAEFIVGAIDQAALFDDHVNAEKINTHLQLAAANGSLSREVTLTQAQVDEIMQRFMSEFARYRALPEGGHLDLHFPIEALPPMERASALAGWPKARVRR